MTFDLFVCNFDPSAYPSPSAGTNIVLIMKPVRTPIPKFSLIPSWVRNSDEAETRITSFWNLSQLVDDPWPALMALALAYPILCSFLRFQRVNARQRQLRFKNRQSLSEMTTVQAQYIIKEMIQWEFPFMFQISLQFALFKVVSAPSLSSTKCSKEVTDSLTRLMAFRLYPAYL